MAAVIAGIAVGVLLVIILVASAIKVVREYQRIVLFRLGRSLGARGPGILFLNPVTDRANWVDLREQYLEIPHQSAITRDNAIISIDFIIFYKVLDPVMSVLEVQNFAGAAQNVAATSLRSVVGDMTLDDVLSKREEMNSVLRTKLDDVTERWGVKVTNVEVREINPPPGVQEAMTRQMSAERSRRAIVTESEGQKQAQITVSEGQKQSAVLAAEGQKQAAILRAEGLALALEQVTNVAREVDSNTLLLQYLDALRDLASSPSTKVLLPMELTNLLGGLRDAASRQLGSLPSVLDGATADGASVTSDGDSAGADGAAQ